MTPAQKKFIELEKNKEVVKQFFDQLQAATEELVKEMGVGAMFQDEEGTVYKLVEPEGRYVHYEKYGYVRTRRQGERQGTLSLKEAEAAGFKLNNAV